MDKRPILQSEVTGEGRPLVLVPGGLTGWKSWEPFVKYFAGLGRKVVRVQLLSVQYGIENHQLPPDYTVKTESQALKETLDSLRLTSQVDLIAWSFGGFVSLDLAMDYPERIKSLTLIEPPALWVIRNKFDADAQTKKFTEFLESLHGAITDEMLSEFLVAVGFVQNGESPRNLPQWRQWLPFKLSLRNSPAVVKHSDNPERLRNLKSPVLLVKGTGSATFLHKIIDVLSSKLPDSRIIELPGGHAPHIASREKFLQEWERFQEEHVFGRQGLL